MRSQPIAFRWVEVIDPDASDSGELIAAMVPHPRYARLARKLFGEFGTEHVLEETGERSAASHRQYFAALHDAWMNLREDVAPKFPSAEHLRHFLLIECNLYDQDIHGEYRDKEGAMNGIAAIRNRNSFARISSPQKVEGGGWVFVVRYAKSQDYAHMNKEEFEASKKAVLDLAEQFTGIPRGQAMREAGRSA